MIIEIRRTKIYITNSYYIVTISVSAASIALAWIATMVISINIYRFLSIYVR